MESKTGDKKVQKNKTRKNILTAVMIFAYAASVGTAINGVFVLFGTAGRDVSVVRIFTVAVCFFVAGTILKGVLRKGA